MRIGPGGGVGVDPGGRVGVAVGGGVSVEPGGGVGVDPGGGAGVGTDGGGDGSGDGFTGGVGSGVTLGPGALVRVGTGNDPSGPGIAVGEGITAVEPPFSGGRGFPTISSWLLCWEGDSSMPPGPARATAIDTASGSAAGGTNAFHEIHFTQLLHW